MSTITRWVGPRSDWRKMMRWEREGARIRRMTGLPAPDDWDIQVDFTTVAQAEREVNEKNAKEIEQRLLRGDR